MSLSTDYLDDERRWYALPAPLGRRDTNDDLPPDPETP
jgi:hypothetical protein